MSFRANPLTAIVVGAGIAVTAGVLRAPAAAARSARPAVAAAVALVPEVVERTPTIAASVAEAGASREVGASAEAGASREVGLGRAAGGVGSAPLAMSRGGILPAWHTGAAEREMVDDDPSLCSAPAPDLARWSDASTGAVQFKLPPRFILSSSVPDGRIYRSGSRIIGVARGTEPTFLSGDATATVQSRCTAVIDGRPVEIAAMRVTLADTAMAPSGNAGTKFVALAQWIGASGGRDVSVWIYTPYSGDMMSLRQLFWTVRFDSPAGQTTAAPAAAAPGAPATAAPATAGTPAPVATPTAAPVAAPTPTPTPASTPPPSPPRRGA